jgi:hypothetical protein
MKVAILGLDSLDADRVRDRYDFDALRLAESAKLDLEGLTGAEVHTKIIWPILLDGNHPNHGDAEVSTPQRLSRLARSVGLPEGVRQRLGSLFDEIRVFDETGRSLTVADSFLAAADTPAAISVPGLSEMTVATEVRSALSGQMRAGSIQPTRGFWHACEVEHEVKRAATLAALDETDVVMTHFYALDAVQHVAQNTDESRVEAWYRRYAALVEEVLDAVGDDGVVVLLSDHGMVDGVHGPDGKGAYAYAASSRPLGIDDGTPISEVPSVLRGLVADATAANDDRDADADDGRSLGDESVAAERRQHLEDLGYF